MKEGKKNKLKEANVLERKEKFNPLYRILFPGILLVNTYQGQFSLCRRMCPECYFKFFHHVLMHCHKISNWLLRGVRLRLVGEWKVLADFECSLQSV